MKINKHFLEGSKIKYEDTPNHGGPFKDGDLDTIVLHYTGSPNVESAVRTLKNPKAAASKNLLWPLFSRKILTMTNATM